MSMINETYISNTIIIGTVEVLTMNRERFFKKAEVSAREQTENSVRDMILAIRARTPAPVFVEFTATGDIKSVRVCHAQGFTDEPQGPFRFIQQARVWCAANPAPGAVAI